MRHLVSQSCALTSHQRPPADRQLASHQAPADVWSLTSVRSKPWPTSSSRAVISCTVPHSGTRALIRTGFVLKSSGASVLALLSSGRGGVHPDSPTC